MTYQVLARKWRPQDFPSLIGQQAVVTALTNALREGRVAQAYLFSGIRGVGKTTAARLFAKALNCEREPEQRPCGSCTPCLEITAGSDLDVLEIDAATYSKVEQVRELAESLKYGPARDRYKVVVLDEVHRLSRQAFDALLKIIEEPPPRLVFIFATTEIDSVPATILSRCQEYHFRRVPAAEVAAHLAEIAREEGITASARALRLLARAGEGSVRDSVALLDQLATFGNNSIDEAEATRLVGGLDLSLFRRVLGAILEGDSPTVAALAAEVEAQGWDPRQVHAHFLAYCRDALHLALGGDAAALDLPAEEAEELAALASAAGYENLLRLLHHLLASESTVRRSDAASLALELAWLKAAELPKLQAVEALLAGASANDSPPATPPRARFAAAPARVAAPRAAPAPAVAEDPPPPPSPRDALAAVPATRPEGEGLSARARAANPADDPLQRFREELVVRRPTLAAQLESVRCVWEEGELKVEVASDDALAARQLARPSNRELLDAAVVAAFGAGSRWRKVEVDPADPAPLPPPSRDGVAEAEARQRAAQNPQVQAVLDVFGGSIATVAPVSVDEADSEEFEE